MDKKAYVIRHLAFEDLGSWESIINKSYDIKYFDAGYDDLSNITNDNPDLLIILGGPIGVYESRDYPFLLDEQSIIKHRVINNKPTLGICLGAQLIAASMGAKVYKGHMKEIGWSPLKVAEPKLKNYFQFFANNNVQVLHWHGDTFDLPQGAVLLASSSLYPNQAFTFNDYILALQFHPEVTERGMEKWFIGHNSEIFHNNINLAELRSNTKKYAALLTQNSILFLEEWLHTINC